MLRLDIKTEAGTKKKKKNDEPNAFTSQNTRYDRDRDLPPNKIMFWNLFNDFFCRKLNFFFLNNNKKKYLNLMTAKTKDRKWKFDFFFFSLLFQTYNFTSHKMNYQSVKKSIKIVKKKKL